jgi:inorganic pyrophosphatase
MAPTLIDLPAGPKVPEELNVVVEVPKGSRVRYEYDRGIGAFRFIAPLRSGGWPADYGFIPSTISEDGHPIDVLLLTEEPNFPGCVVPARPVGVLHLTDGRRPDHKVICVPLAEGKYSEVRDLGDLPEGCRDGIDRFYAENPLVSGTEETVDGWEDAEAARDVVFKAWEGFLL